MSQLSDADAFSPGRATEAIVSSDQQKYYADWAATYDEVSSQKRYKGWQCIKELSVKHLNMSDRILCVGAGTGVEGELLRKEGFQTIHGHDGSAEMLEKAKKRNAFDEYYQEFLLPNQETKSFRTAFYDALLCVGCFLPNHLDERHLPDLVRCLRSGGILILGTREKFVHDPYNLERYMQQMEKDGVWKLIERKTYEKYSEGDTGVFYVYKKN